MRACVCALAEVAVSRKPEVLFRVVVLFCSQNLRRAGLQRSFLVCFLFIRICFSFLLKKKKTVLRFLAVAPSAKPEMGSMEYQPCLAGFGLARLDG